MSHRLLLWTALPYGYMITFDSPLLTDGQSGILELVWGRFLWIFLPLSKKPKKNDEVPPRRRDPFQLICSPLNFQKWSSSLWLETNRDNDGRSSATTPLPRTTTVTFPLVRQRFSGQTRRKQPGCDASLSVCDTWLTAPLKTRLKPSSSLLTFSGKR